MAEKKKKFTMVNYYDRITKEDNDLYNYPNEQLLQITIPFRGIVQGPSGSGKTNVMMNLISGIGIWDKVVILAKNLDEPLYKYAIKAIQSMEVKQKRRILLAIDKVSDLPPIGAFNPQENTLLIVDDFVADDPKSLKPLNEIWLRGRKNSISPIFISQSYFDTPKIIRKNSDYVFIKKLGNPMDLTRIAKEYALGVTVSEIQAKYNKALAGGEFTDFFMIDRNNKDPKLVFRHNFDPIDD